MKISLKNLFQKEKHTSLYYHEFHIYRDWGMILGFSFVALCAIVLWSAWLFVDVTFEFGASGDTPSSISPVSINQTLLQGTVDRLDIQAKTFEDMKHASSTFVDPSR